MNPNALMLAGLFCPEAREQAEEMRIQYADEIQANIDRWRKEGRSETWINYELVK